MRHIILNKHIILMEIQNWTELLFLWHFMGWNLVLPQIQYSDAMKIYHNSSVYQAWVTAKSKADMEHEEERESKSRSSVSAAITISQISKSSFQLV